MNGWPTEPLRRLVEINYGHSLPDRIRESTGEVPVYGSNGIVGRHTHAVARAPAIVIGRKGSIGALNYATAPCWPIDTAYFIDVFPERLLPMWLFVSLSTMQLSQLKQDGPKAGIRREDLYQLEIPVPPLADQQRLIARIESLTSRLEQARDFLRQNNEQVENFLRALVFNDEKPSPTKMRNLLRLRPTDVAVQKTETYQFAGVYSFGRGVFRSVAKPGYDFAYSRLTRVKAGEFTYPKLMAWEGALGMVPPECNGCVVSPEFPVFEVDTDRVFPEVLDVYFRTPSVWPKLAGLSTGTNVRRRRLNPQAFLDYEMALPSRATQLKVRAAYAKQTELRRLQKETEAELAAFTPALLAKAFRGEL